MNRPVQDQSCHRPLWLGYGILFLLFLLIPLCLMIPLISFDQANLFTAFL